MLDIEFSVQSGFQLNFNMRPLGANALAQVHVHHLVVVDAQGIADGVLRDLEPANQTPVAGRHEK